jgi:hypothetical protein
LGDVPRRSRRIARLVSPGDRDHADLLSQKVSGHYLQKRDRESERTHAISRG